VKKTIIIIIVFYAALSFFICSYLYEDAFIFFRVAEYICNGFGCVFNPGERIEVCSSFSWLMLLTLFRSLGANILITSKILGIFFGCCSLFLIYKITALFTARTSQQVLPPLLTAISLPFLMWNQMGCETALCTLVFLSLIFVCLDRQTFVYWPVILLILTVTRPEGLFMFLGIVPAFFLYRGRTRRALYSTALFAILYLTILAARFAYFADLVPSAFYVKIYSGKYLEGLIYVHNYFSDYYMYYFCILLLFFVWRKHNWQEKRCILFGFIIVYLSWVILGGAEPKIYYRHVIPLIPLVYIYTATGLEYGFGDFTTGKKWMVNFSMISFGCVSLLLPQTRWIDKTVENPVIVSALRFADNPYAYVHFCLERVKNPAAYNYIDSNTQLVIGDFIRRNYFSGTTILYDQMGQTPYQAGIDYFFIDSWGLTDKKIGKYYFHDRNKESYILRMYANLSTRLIKRVFPQTTFIHSRQEMLDYVFERRPDVIMMVSALHSFEDFLPNWLPGESRFKDQYRRKFLICGTLIYEQEGLIKKPLDIPKELSVTYR
jgi:hypothetical protein